MDVLPAPRIVLIPAPAAVTSFSVMLATDCAPDEPAPVEVTASSVLVEVPFTSTPAAAVAVTASSVLLAAPAMGEVPVPVEDTDALDVLPAPAMASLAAADDDTASRVGEPEPRAGSTPVAVAVALTVFAATPQTDAACHEFQMLLREAAQLPASKRLKATLRLVGRQVAGLKPAAGPGPSGWRNSHVQCVYADPAGPEALASWVQIWASGTVSPW